MLKTLSIKSKEPKKSIIKIGYNGREKHNNKAELDIKDEISVSEINAHKIKNNDITKEKNH